MIDSIIGLLIYCTLYNWFQGNNHPFNAIAIVCIISVSISIESTTGKAVAGPILQNLGCSFRTSQSSVNALLEYFNILIEGAVKKHFGIKSNSYIELVAISVVVSVPVLFPLAACSCFTGQC